MKSRTFLSAIAIAASLGTAALAGSHDLVLQQLGELGFTQIQVKRTLLGRTRIVAINGSIRREIVIHTRSGEILRDIWEDTVTGKVGTGLFPGAAGLAGVGFDPEGELTDAQEDALDAAEDARDDARDAAEEARERREEREEDDEDDDD